LLLKRYEDKVVAVSDLEDRKSASNETFRNKAKLKDAGFSWDSKLNSWTISKYKMDVAQETISKINKSPVSQLIKAIEDLPEFVLNADNLSRKDELSAKIDGFIDELGKEASAAATSEEVRKFIEFNRRFRKYSLCNTLLIYMQRKDASRVAGYRTWQEKFHRVVRKGSKAIVIFAPVTKKEDEDVNDAGFDAAVRRRSYTFFRAVNVFDVKDTDPIDASGELPAEPQWHDANTPSATADKMYEYASAVATELGISLTGEEAQRGEQGYSAGDHINITSDVAGVNKVATLIHEIAHELMHWSKTSLFYVGEEDASSREKKELQAETVSYVVLRHYDLPAKHQAIYLALWNKSPDVAAAVKDNLNHIRKVSNFIIDKIDAVAAESNKPTEVK